MEVYWEVSEVLNYVSLALVRRSLPVGVHVNDVFCGMDQSAFFLSVERHF